MQDAKQEEIAGTTIFCECTKADVAWIAKVADVLDAGAGSVLSIAGRTPREFMVVLEGVASGGGVIYGPSSYVGIGLVDDSPNRATIEALTDLRVLVFGPREFRGLLARVPSIAKILMADLSARVRTQDELSLRAVS